MGTRAEGGVDPVGAEGGAGLECHYSTGTSRFSSSNQARKTPPHRIENHVAGAERVPSTSLFRLSGSHRTCGHAHLFAQPRTRRISQFCGLNRPNGSSTSPLRAGTSLPDRAGFFLKISRAASPTASPGRASWWVRAHGMGTRSSSSLCQFWTRMSCGPRPLTAGTARRLRP